MEKCVNCGFEATPTNRQLLNLYKREFGTLPILAMLGRGWLGDVDRFDIPAIEAAVLKFFDVANEDELWGLLSKPPSELVYRAAKARI